MGATVITVLALALAAASIALRLAAHLVGRSKAAIPAQLVALATGGNLRVVERIADRRRRSCVLHSVEGSERSPDRVVSISEELLPYAVMWGIEKSWLRALVGNAAGSLDAPPAWLSDPESLTYLGSGKRIRY